MGWTGEVEHEGRQGAKGEPRVVDLPWQRAATTISPLLLLNAAREAATTISPLLL